MVKKKNKDITKWIGYILFFVALFGWGISTGRLYQKIDAVEVEVIEISKKIDQQQNLFLQQEKLNGEVLILIELMKQDYVNRTKKE